MPAACTGPELAVTPGAYQAGLTHVGLAVEFRNLGDVACHIRGYPRVVALNKAGHVVADAVQTPRGYLGGLLNGTATLPLVVVLPGQRASAFVEGEVFNVRRPDASCPPYRALLVTPPSASQAVRVPLNSDLCSGLFVHPVVPGTSGQVWRVSPSLPGA
jgi:hypothetical protein